MPQPLAPPDATKIWLSTQVGTGRRNRCTPHEGSKDSADMQDLSLQAHVNTCDAVHKAVVMIIPSSYTVTGSHDADGRSNHAPD